MDSNIRSKNSIRSSPKKNSTDPSIAAAVLETTPMELAMDPETAGLLFENLINRDFNVYVEKIGGDVHHYRDRYGQECDHIIHFHNVRNTQEPSFLMVVTGSEMALTTNDGIFIVPMGCLKD